MDSLTITLPEPLRRYVEGRVEAGGFGTADHYFRDLVEQDRQKVEIDRLEALALEGLASGEPIEMNDAWWARKYAEFDERYGTAQ